MDLICQECGSSYDADLLVWHCRCGGLLDLEFEPSFPVEEVERRPPGIWRYREAIPVDKDESIVSFGEGFTPLVEAELGEWKVLLKLEYLFPTGSSTAHPCSESQELDLSPFLL